MILFLLAVWLLFGLGAVFWLVEWGLWLTLWGIVAQLVLVCGVFVLIGVCRSGEGVAGFLREVSHGAMCAKCGGRVVRHSKVRLALLRHGRPGSLDAVTHGTVESSPERYCGGRLHR